MIEGVLFDKDGTLFDFHRSWSGWAAGILSELSQGDAQRRAALAEVAGFDLQAKRFHKTSPVIAGTLADTARRLLPLVPQYDMAQLHARLVASAVGNRMVEAAPLGPLLSVLRRRKLVLGVATNDDEAAARAHLDHAKVLSLFAFISGADSGFLEKPHPDMVLGFVKLTGLPPRNIAMVGDSVTDLQAAKAAGAWAVAVLTGPADEAELADEADVVLPSIAALPRWIDSLKT